MQCHFSFCSTCSSSDEVSNGLGFCFRLNNCFTIHHSFFSSPVGEKGGLEGLEGVCDGANNKHHGGYRRSKELRTAAEGLRIVGFH